VAITIGSCEECSKTDITGYVASVQKRLCPVCSAPLLGVPEHDIRQFSEAQLFHTHGQDSPSPSIKRNFTGVAWIRTRDQSVMSRPLCR
jgi:hypothetical protein